MKKAAYVVLIICIVALVYAGCKDKTRAAGIPVGIFRVTYSDSDQANGVNAGDQLIIQFDRHVTTNVAQAVGAVFELSNGGDSFGTGATWVQTSGHAVTVTLGTGPVLTISIDDFVTSQVRINAAIPFGAIRDATWLTTATGGGVFSAIEGRVGYAAPVLLSAVYDDFDVSGTLTQGDTIVLTFTGPINTYVGNFWPWLTFIVPVNWDGLGSGALALQTGADEITITLGSGAKLAIPLVHQVGVYAVDSPSGIDISISQPSGRITYDVGSGIEVNVPPMAIDIQ